MLSFNVTAQFAYLFSALLAIVMITTAQKTEELLKFQQKYAGTDRG